MTATATLSEAPPAATGGMAPADQLPVQVLTLAGVITRASLDQACRQLAQAGPVPRLLVDLREIEGPRPDSARVQLACHLVVYFASSSIALLARKESINRVTEGIVVSAGVRLRQFWREDAALEWLRSV